MTGTTTIAVCTRNRPSSLRRCLDSLAPQIDATTELVVVDSAPSSPDVRPIATEFGAHYLITSRPGLSLARNVALRAARHDVIAFIDDDAVAAPDWVQRLEDSFADPSVVCVTGRILPLELRTEAQRCFEEHFSFDRGPLPAQYSQQDPRPWFAINPWPVGVGCNMAFRRRLFDVIGPFDEALGVGTIAGGADEIDVFRRLLRAGYTVTYNPAALVHHQHRVTMSAVRSQVWSYGKSYTALMTKSILYEKHMIGQALRLTIYGFFRQGRRCVRWLLGRPSPPMSLILSETLGHLVGLMAYAYLRRGTDNGQLLPSWSEPMPGLEMEGGLGSIAEMDQLYE
jgi:GT2 family glycosyltransferase